MTDTIAKVARATGWPGRFLAIMTGMAIATGQAPLGAWGLAVFGVVLAFILLVYRAKPVSAFAGGFWVGFGFSLFAMSWIVEPFFVDPLRHGWMAPFAIVFMSAGFGMFWGAGALVAALISRPGGWARVAAIAAGWTGAELLRSYVFTGLPWALVSLQWIDTPVYQIAATVGPHGVTFATLFLVGVTALGITRSSALPIILSACAGISIWFAGEILRNVPPDAEGAPRPVVRMIQPNAPQHLKWDPAWRDVFFERQISLMRQPGEFDLAVWPEVAVTFALNSPSAPYGLISEAAGGAKVVLGGQRIADGRAFNSVLALDESGQGIALYDKHHLVPFGEYIPGGRFARNLGLRGIAERAAYGFAAGSGPAIMEIGPNLRFIPLICYEAIFPHEIRRVGTRPDFLLNMTNDAWFGSWSGPYQHLAQARARAIEFGLPVVRVANTGVSAVFAANGQALGMLPLGEQGYSDVMLPAPFDSTAYWRNGDKPVIILLIVVIMLLGALRMRNPIDAVTRRQ